MSENQVQTNSDILLVTPVWRDSERLSGFGQDLAQHLTGSDHDIHWVIADDGSGEKEHDQLVKLQKKLAAIYPNISLHFADAHHGKGSVVREAWSLHPEANWLAFVDADGSLPPAEFIRMVEAALESKKTVLGIRRRTDTTDVQLSLPRAIAHRLFIWAVRILVGVRCEDPQCGAKLLKGSDFRQVASSLKENGLAFDAEMLAALSAVNATWKELPVTWIEKDGGRVHPMRDGWGMLAALWKIRVRQRNGEFSN